MIEFDFKNAHHRFFFYDIRNFFRKAHLNRRAFINYLVSFRMRAMVV